MEFLSLKGGCTGSFESTHVKMPHCWKSDATAQLSYGKLFVWAFTVCLLAYLFVCCFVVYLFNVVFICNSSSINLNYDIPKWEFWCRGLCINTCSLTFLLEQLGANLTTVINGPRYEISNNVVCVTLTGSDQPAHTRSLVRAFACRLNIVWLLS